QPSPAFITDHPPVYQSEPFAWVDEDIDAFRQLTNELLITYSEAMRQHERRSYGVALNMLDWCLERAPRFTLARIAAAETLMRTGRLEEAQRAILLVIQQAPDNPRALYSAAYILAQLDESERAKGMLQVFYTTAKDPDLIARGRLLESFLERGISVVPGAPIPTEPMTSTAIRNAKVTAKRT
ncbi:MAG: hypothetical protein IH969_03990, partial [Candidatus Krumholzibacteriota bacterium]|nr:hypothetical protein [Candidatus Krumholzibacteriota bacterium]